MSLRRTAWAMILTAALCGAPGTESAVAEMQRILAAHAGLSLDAQPVTVTLSPESAAALEQAHSEESPLGLAIEGIEGNVAQAVRINVFVDKPDASRLTPTEDPHYAGTISLLPRASGAVSKTGAIFDLTHSEALKAGRPLTVTLVPVVGTEHQKPERVALRIAAISLKVLK